MVRLHKSFDYAFTLGRNQSPSQNQLTIERNEKVIIEGAKPRSDAGKKLTVVGCTGCEVTESSNAN